MEYNGRRADIVARRLRRVLQYQQLAESDRDGDQSARDTARRLASEEGIFVGNSAGATVAAALRVAEHAPKGSVLLAMLPDTGERYLSTILFEGVSEGSDDEWLASIEPRKSVAAWISG